MARWQLQCSGKSEEAACKFCDAPLPDWREALFKDIIDAADADDAADDDDDDARGKKKRGAQKRASDGKKGRAGRTGRASAPGALGDANDASGSGSGSDDSATTTTATAPSRRESSPPTLKASGDIIVKFNNMSFRCKVRTGQEGLSDFMEQIREKCGIPEDKMGQLNLTYRCKDPSTGSQMTLEGVNESAFDAAVLCSAAQDKKRASSGGKGSTRSSVGSTSSAHKRSLDGGGGGARSSHRVAAAGRPSLDETRASVATSARQPGRVARWFGRRRSTSSSREQQVEETALYRSGAA